MPIPTSSMYQNAPRQNPRRQQARQLWAEFRLYAMKARKGMQDRRTMALQDVLREWQMKPGRSNQEREQQRDSLMKLHERQYFLEMREEWQRMLHSNGLQHEDWGEVTAQEMAVIRQVLGPDDIEEGEEEEVIQVGNNAESHNHHPPTEFVPANVAAQPLSQSVSHQSQASASSQSSFSSNHHSYGAPSLASRSQNSSSASYAFVDPRNFTDDERDDYPNPYSARRGANYTVPSEDEASGIPIPSYKTWAAGSQHQSSGFATHHPSNPDSLSSSPDAPISHSYHQQPSSLSSTSHFPSHVPSSLSKSVVVEDDADRIFLASTLNGATSSSVAGAKLKSKFRSGYIGPQVTTNDSENEADADFASMSKADQIAAYEKFKRGTRIQKIREFHDEAAGLDIELAEKIYGVSDKVWVANVITQHEQDMLKLRVKKEEERNRLVHDERTRMSAEIKKGRNGATGAPAIAKKSGWSASSTAAPKATSKKANPISTTTTSSAFSTANKTPVAPPHKPKMPTTMAPASAMSEGFMNLEELQSVLQNAPDMGLDSAFQITQLLKSEGGASASDYGQEHADQEWGTPQIRHKPNTKSSNTSANATGPRKRTDSVSVLDESRFGTISAKGKQRRGTITVSTAAASNNESTNANGFWKPQGQPPSPEQSEAMTDQYAKMLLSGGGSGGPPTRTSASTAAMHQVDDEDDWMGGWGSKLTGTPKATPASANYNMAGSGARSKRPTQTTGTSSPAAVNASGWGVSAKKTLGFNAGGWDEQWAHGAKSPDDFEQVVGAEAEEEEEEEELIQPSPFDPHGVQKKSSSLLSDMMMKGRNVVAGAVGAALGPMNGAPSPVPSAPPMRKNSAQMSAVPTPPPAVPATTTSKAGKKVPKKGRQANNKKPTSTPLMDQEEEETRESEPPPQMTTPRAAASSTKFTSTWGSQNNSTSGFVPGSPSSRNAPASSGMWDDMISTTPRPGGLSNGFGTHGQGTGTSGGVRRPSGLHNQVWNAGVEEEQEEQEEQEEEAEGEEDEWNMPGSLNARGGFGAGPRAGKVGSGLTSGAKKNTTQSTSGWSAWGSSPASNTKSTSASATNSKKGAMARKHQVTVEEIPDESVQPDRSPSNFLAPDSRIILEPKPSKPSMFDDLFQLSAEGTSPEDKRHHPPMGKRRTSASAAANVANVEQGGDEVFNEAWFQKAAMQLKQGTEQGNKLFGAPSGTPQATPQSRNGVNVPPGGPGNKSSNTWGASPNVAGSMSGSFKDSSPLAGGPPPKMSSTFGDNSNTQKPIPNSAWGSGMSSSPKVGVGFGKASNAKAKPTTGTSAGFGAGGFGWGSASPSVFGANAHGASEREDDPWGGRGEEQWEEEKAEEELERERELVDSRKKLQDLFGDSPASNAKPTVKAPAGGPKMAGAKAKALREQREREGREWQERQVQEQEEREAREQEEREAQEQEEREAQEREEREAQVRAAKEKEAKEKAEPAAAAKTTAPKAGGKRVKGKKR